MLLLLLTSTSVMCRGYEAISGHQGVDKAVQTDNTVKEIGIADSRPDDFVYFAY